MLKIDLHIHTIASGHAYNTILEYANKAKELKMKIIGISDHGPNLLGSATNEIYFRAIDRLPRKISGVTVLRGIEANILQDGSIDISEGAAKHLDYVMAAFHKDVVGIKDQGIKGNTKTMVKAIRSGRIQILTHPYLTKFFDVDISVIAEEACKNRVLLEVNLSTLNGLTERTKKDLQLIINIVKKHRQKVIVNSDSHNIWELADDASLKKMKNIIDLPKELIINNYPEELLKFLEIENEK